MMKNLLLFILTIFGINQINSQTINNFTSSDGLADNVVYDIDIGEDGTIWFGTRKGVTSLKNGIWESMVKDDFPIIPDDNILVIKSTDDGLWIGTDFGAAYYNGSMWTLYDETQGLGDNRVKDIYVHDDEVWFGHYDGVSVLEDGNWTQYTRNDGLPFGGVSHITSKRDVVYLSTALGGVFLVRDNTFSKITEDEGLLTNRVVAMSIDNNDYKWIATSDGISVFNDINEHIVNYTRPFQLPPPDTLNPITDVKIDSDGNIWAGIYVDYLVTVGGVSKWDGQDWRQWDVSNGLIGPVVNALAVASNDDIWVATSTGVSQIVNMSTSVVDDMEESIKIYPNPTVGLVNLSDPNTGVVKVYDISGSQIMTIEKTSYDIEIDVSNFAKGVYILEYNNALKKIVKR